MVFSLYVRQLFFRGGVVSLTFHFFLMVGRSLLCVSSEPRSQRGFWQLVEMAYLCKALGHSAFLGHLIPFPLRKSKPNKNLEIGQTANSCCWMLSLRLALWKHTFIDPKCTCFCQSLRFQRGGRAAPWRGRGTRIRAPHRAAAGPRCCQPRRGRGPRAPPARSAANRAGGGAGGRGPAAWQVHLRLLGRPRGLSFS